MPNDLPSTILHHAAFCEAYPAGYDGAFHWEYLFGAFPRGITPMDLDAVVEINDHFLGFETKDHGVPIKEGQQKTLRALVRSGVWTIVYIEGKKRPRRWMVKSQDRLTMPVIARCDLRPAQMRDCDEEIVWNFCYLWAKAIDPNGIWPSR